MEDLIKALQIFLKYKSHNINPMTTCEHDVLYVCGITPDDVTPEDKKTLDALGFFTDKYGECFKSFRFGSA